MPRHYTRLGNNPKAPKFEEPRVFKEDIGFWNEFKLEKERRRLFYIENVEHEPTPFNKVFASEAEDTESELQKLCDAEEKREKCTIYKGLKFGIKLRSYKGAGRGIGFAEITKDVLSSENLSRLIVGDAILPTPTKDATVAFRLPVTRKMVTLHFKDGVFTNASVGRRYAHLSIPMSSFQTLALVNSEILTRGD